ncbi:MAG TPA: DUF917 domain-containing protein [Candidatus Sulfotelmatobacter sp.]|nr:DUF917 domain-containing protein [Candidatus Sulfotelmatobacter sp.]
MPTVLRDSDSIQDFVMGLAFFGTGGGGGRLEDGIEMLLPLVRGGDGITLTDPDELPDDVWTCSVSSLGGRDPDTPPSGGELASYGLVQERLSLLERMTAAVRELAALRAVKIGALVSVELGSAATVGTILAARALGVPVLDSDYTGRAKPEVVQSKTAMHGKPRAPMALVDRWGNVTLLKRALTDMMADRLGRHISMAAYGHGVGAAGHLLPLGEVRPALVRGSLLKAIPVGEALRLGVQDSDRVARLKALTGGGVLFEGTAEHTEWENDPPYTFRRFTYHLQGRGRCAGQSCRVWVKNEHHVVWRNGKLVGTSPDILVVLDAETNRPLSTRGEVTPGRGVVVFGMEPIEPVWHSPKGFELLGPRHFGFDFDYVRLDPIKE